MAEPSNDAAEAAEERALLRASSLELLELRLERFGPYKSRSVRFQPGLNLVYGPNASGKSTITSALFYALTGHALQPSARPAQYAQEGAGAGTLTLSFRAQATPEAAAGGAQLSLYPGGAPSAFRLVRTTAGDLELASTEAGRTIVLAQTPGKSRLAIQRMLGIDQHRLGLAHFLREDEVGHFLSQTGGERKNLLRAALSLDRWERALKMYREARRLARVRHKEVSSALGQLAGPLEGPEARLDALRRELKDAQAERGHLLEAEGGERLVELGRAKARALELERELSGVLFPLPSSAHLLAELSRLEEELERLSTLDSDLGFARQHFGELLGLQQSVASDLARLRTLLDAAEHHCPTCEQPLDLSLIGSLIAQKERRLAELTAELASAREALERLEGAERHRDEQRRLYSDLRVKREKVRTLTAELEGVLSWMESARAQASGEAAQRLAALEERTAAARAQLEALLREVGAAAERRKQHEVLQEREAGARRLRLRTEAAVDALEAAVSEVAEGWFGPMERRLQALLQSVGVLAGLAVDVHSDPMRPRLGDAEGQRDLVALSGSERALVYLCLKAALSETLGIVPFLALDEPTVHLDAERKRRLVRLLRQLAGTRKQVIVATNDAGLLDALAGSHVISLAPQ
jgi:DNA repair exonuclease SbcCD ATPase subunit